MNNWVTSKTGFPQGGNKLVNNTPVNLDVVDSFNKTVYNTIKFYYQDNSIIEWNFINISMRDAEYTNILKFMKANSAY